jgi:hypothetical protein
MRKRRASDPPEEEAHKKRDYTGDIIKLLTAIVIAYGGGYLTNKEVNRPENLDIFTKTEADKLKDRVLVTENNFSAHMESEKKDRELMDEKFEKVQIQLSALDKKIDYLIKVNK